MSEDKNTSEFLKQFLKDRTISKTKALVKWLFPNLKPAQNITNTQALIVKKIAFSETRRLSISAYTRYGKSQVVAIAVALYILLNQNKKVKFIGPTDDKAQIIKNYMSELILSSRGDILLNLSEINIKTKQERIKAEASSKRMTFKNGCEYRVVTAHGKGFSMMGHGGDLIVLDEAAEISRESYAKITRMLGDDPENSALVELFNPWNRDTKAYDHSISERFERIRIDWRVGVSEGRTTKAYVQEQQDDITPLEFTVLYESQFPEESEDSLFNLRDLDRAIKDDKGFQETVRQAEKVVSNAQKHTEGEVNKAKQVLSEFTKVVGCDPADKGMDQSVVLFGIKKGNDYELVDYYSEDKSESMTLVGTVWRKAKSFIGKNCTGVINIDMIGIGTGAFSRLKELSLGFKNIKVVGAHFGERALNDKEFVNKKAENYFRVRALLQQGNLSLLPVQKLKSQLMSMRWDLTSGEKKRVLDPEGYSPDWSDALTILIWKGRKGLSYAFV